MPNQSSKKRWGATQAEWDAFIRLAPEDLRPVASCPLVIDDEGTLDTSRMKVPSMFVGGAARRMKEWPTYKVTTGDLAMWSADPRHGICLVTRNIRAIDVDVDDPELADQVDDFWCEWFEADLPVRTRAGASRMMLLYRLTEDEGEKAKARRKIAVFLPGHANNNSRMVEFLFDRQQTVVAGSHHSGERYAWPEGIPETMDDIPAISPARLAEGIDVFLAKFEGTTTRQFEGDAEALDYERDRAQIDRTSPTYEYVTNHECFREELHNGALAVQCPWHESHSNPHLDEVDPTKTVFFPVGLGGSATPGFACQHTSHGPKNVADFLEAIGYSVLDEFDLVAEEKPVQAESPDGQIVELDQTPPNFMRVTKQGMIPCNEINLTIALRWPAGLRLEVALDEFKGLMVIRHMLPQTKQVTAWRPFTDEDYVDITMRLLCINFMSVNHQMLTRCIANEAVNNKFDSGLDWGNSLKWDGIDRLGNMAVNVLGAQDTPYSHAVVKYTMTALAGRLMEPGIKADMAPVLVGAQGLLKTSFVRALAPTEDTFSEQDLSARDADMARELRGKLVVELGELRGLGSRDEESIKSWMTRTREEWVPKFKEFTTTYYRRFIMIGTTNVDRFLADVTGNRRWLPLKIGITRPKIDVDWVKENRDQLWAQAIEIFRDQGILWKEAEELAVAEHDEFTRTDPMQLMLSRWIAAEGHTQYGPEGFNLIQVANSLGHAARQGMSVSRTHFDLSRAFARLGYVETSPGNYELPFL